MRYGNSIPARVDVEEYEQARLLKSPYCRNIQEQISFWAKIGRVGLANPNMTIKDVENIVVEGWLKKQEGCPVDIPS